MASAYPTGLDTLATNKADGTATATDHPAHHNDLADAINKIEAELGIAPSGAEATVVARLATIEAAIAGSALAADVDAIEAELGANPSGAAADVAARFTAIDTALAGASIPRGLLYPYGRVAGETSHASSLFDFTTDFAANWTEYDGNGNVVWTPSANGGLTAQAIPGNQTTVGHAVKPIGLSLPITIETRMNALIGTGANSASGLCFTNGAAASTVFVNGLGCYSGNTYLHRMGNTASSGPNGGVTTPNFNDGPDSGNDAWLRVVARAAGNPYALLVSADGAAPWINVYDGAGHGTAFTATHMGFYHAWAGASYQVAHFKYLRVYAADLS